MSPMSPMSPTIFSFVLLLSAVAIFWGIWTMVGWFTKEKPRPPLENRKSSWGERIFMIGGKPHGIALANPLLANPLPSTPDAFIKLPEQPSPLPRKRLAWPATRRKIAAPSTDRVEPIDKVIKDIYDILNRKPEKSPEGAMIEFESNGDIFNVWRDDVYIGHYLPADDTLYLYYTTGIGELERAAVGRMARRVRDGKAIGSGSGYKYKFSLNLWLAHDKSRPSALVTEVLKDGPLKATQRTVSDKTIEILPHSWMKFIIQYTKCGVGKTIGFYYADTDKFVGVSTSHLGPDDLEFVNVHITEFRANNFSHRNGKPPRQFAFLASDKPHKYTILCSFNSIGHYDGERNRVVLLPGVVLTARESYLLYKALRPVRAQYAVHQRIERKLTGSTALPGERFVCSYNGRNKWLVRLALQHEKNYLSEVVVTIWERSNGFACTASNSYTAQHSSVPADERAKKIRDYLVTKDLPVLKSAGGVHHFTWAAIEKFHEDKVREQFAKKTAAICESMYGQQHLESLRRARLATKGTESIGPS